MDISTMTVGDLFMEDNFDWVNDEEAMAFNRIEELIREFKKDNGRSPTKIYVSNNEELQSYLMWFSSSYGLKSERTEKGTYLE
tara:strand:+ start:228 stop:476 length:249 start_codon:yes stop_codon:yes gene_type:complete